ncbi:MAG: NUDIX hydrolase, partial [Lactobacillus iners]|nr:NUDIX hydrolase [Lactobacillus iners]
DDDEFLTQVWYSLDELKQLLAQCKIVDSKTVMAINLWENMVLTGNRKND